MTNSSEFGMSIQGYTLHVLEMDSLFGVKSLLMCHTNALVYINDLEKATFEDVVDHPQTIADENTML